MEEKAGNGVRKPHYATEFTTLSGFGLKMLQKYGWKEGEGLGKERSGRTDIIKVTKRKENEGLGVTGKERYWWENMYNNLLQNTDKVGKNKRKAVSDSESSSDSSSSEDVTSKKKEKNVKKRKQSPIVESSSDSSSSEDESSKKKNSKKREISFEGDKSPKNGFVKASQKTQRSFDKRFFATDVTPEYSSDSETEEPKQNKPATIITNHLFSACEGRTLKKYRQTGKELRLAKQAEEAMKKIRENESRRQEER